MTVLLYGRRFDLHSGAGQLVWMQALGLREAGVDVRLACQRGALKFSLRTGLRVERVSARRARGLASRKVTLVDHGAELPDADVVFVHNLLGEADSYLEDASLAERVELEAAFYRQLKPSACLVANSKHVATALMERYGMDPGRIVVHYPGHDAVRFAASRKGELRAKARRALGLDDSIPVLGFVTSGDMHKRGLDLFLAAAERVAAAVPEARFLVVGARHLPDYAREHALWQSAKLLYRPKNKRPELWLAALDVFTYAARFEEFGMVVLEAQAMGLPVLTSRRVGAAECLPPIYEPWLMEQPDSVELAEKSLALLKDEATRRQLELAGIDNSAAYGRHSYVRASTATILGRA